MTIEWREFKTQMTVEPGKPKIIGHVSWIKSATLEELIEMFGEAQIVEWTIKGHRTESMSTVRGCHARHFLHHDCYDGSQEHLRPWARKEDENG